MKKMILSLLLLVFSLSSMAQLDKNNWLVGGSGNFYLSKRDYTYYTATALNGYSNELHLTLYPNVGYFIFDRFAFGLRPYFTWVKGEFYPDDTLSSGATSSSKRYGIGPFVRYYFLDKEKQFNILTDISYQIGEWNFGGQKGRLTNLSLMAGAVVYFNSSVGIEFLMGYNSMSESMKSLSNNKENVLTMGIGFQIHLEK